MNRDLVVLAVIVGAIATGTLLIERRHSSGPRLASQAAVYRPDQQTPKAPGVHLRPATPDGKAVYPGYQFNYICNDEKGMAYSIQIGINGNPLYCDASLSGPWNYTKSVNEVGNLTTEEVQVLRNDFNRMHFSQMQCGTGLKPRPNHIVTVSSGGLCHRIDFYEPPTAEHAEILRLMDDPKLAPERTYERLQRDYRRRFGAVKGLAETRRT
jgi:hypothetical protein